MSDTKHELAIVVPAYRSNHLAAALESILSQTNQRFNLYVFDDASPDLIANIVGEFGSRRAILFHRFEENLGGTSLVAHWQRCLERITEPWIWLFSDDDVMDPTCVAAFYDELNHSNGKHDLYRFNTRIIDADNHLLIENESHPDLESGSDFLLARLQDKRTSTMQELMFSREAYVKTGGIPDFPLAWSSDDAFVAQMGAQHPIKTIAGPRVSWRQSGLSISTNLSSSNAKKKIAASGLMVEWAINFLKKKPPSCGTLSIQDLQSLTSIWFFRRVYHNHVYLDFKTSLEINRLAMATWNWPWGRALIKCLKLNRPLIKNRLVGRIMDLLFTNTSI